MDVSIEFLLRLLDHHPMAIVDWDDLHGRFAGLLAACQAAGFLSRQSSRHPAPTCPGCGKGVPYALGGGHLCDRCHGTVDPKHLQCWSFDLRTFLGWLAAQMHLRGEVRRVDDGLWQLGSHEDPGGACACFFSSGCHFSELARDRLLAYRNAVVLYGLRRPPGVDSLAATTISLLEIMGLGDALTASFWSPRGAGPVRFDAASGRVEAGGVRCGVAPAGSREHAFLACLAKRQDHFLDYDQIKRDVLRATGGCDTRDAASFCHRLKSRIKKRYVPEIDSLVSVSRRGDGYRLLARREA